MNSCERYQELISRLVDGEVSHDEYEALMAHMESCSRCNAMYAVFHDLSDLLAEEAEEPLPEDPLLPFTPCTFSTPRRLAKAFL